MLLILLLLQLSRYISLMSISVNRSLLHSVNGA
jgi:hypothetical protein